MRTVWPYVGIAVAVAVGIAVAPYVWRVLGFAVAFCAISVVYVLAKRGLGAVWARITANEPP